MQDNTLVLDGTSQTLFNGGDFINYFIIQNPAGNGPIKINLAGGNALARGLVIAGGGSYENNKGCANDVTVSGTATQSIVCFGG